MEDRSGVVLAGIEESIVKSSREIFALLEQGSAKRRTAETLLNKQSSRSHSGGRLTRRGERPSQPGSASTALQPRCSAAMRASLPRHESSRSSPHPPAPAPPTSVQRDGQRAGGDPRRR